ncbi:MAG TPA: glycerophosphodiester phosphodiesterase family protein [Xanthobacteraceae bacterium]|jgi:glycerophosphoryl diester phosphodiesterase
MPDSLDWLSARPIAHRGLHNAAAGLIENTSGAVQAAIASGYGIEVDVQISADGEAMVHHDDVLGRLTEGDGRLDRLTADALKRVAFRDSAERMMTLGELCDLVAGRVTILIEMKSRFDGDDRLPARVAKILADYRGPAAPMSFDPLQVAMLRQKAPQVVRGIAAAKYRPHPYWDLMPAWMKYGMGYLITGVAAHAQFVAYSIADLPAPAPWLARRVLGLPLLTWTVRTQAERQCAERWADQMIFEGFRP